MSFFSDPRWGEALAHLPDYLGNHVRVSVTALALGLLVSLPLAVAARNQPVMRGVLLGLASIVQTVPGLALLALFYPLLLALAAITLSWFGFGFSAFGFVPAVLALALYSMLPVLRNTITGLRGVDPAILEAAQGVGMTPRQSLFTVELPLALRRCRPRSGKPASAITSLQGYRPRTGCSCCSALLPPRCSRSRSINCWP